jgi:phage-related protein
MKLQYRGNSYEQNPLLRETAESQITANYRGATYKIKQSVNPTVPDSIVNLKYRGVYYQTGTTPTFNSTQPTKIPAFSTQEKARLLMHNQKRTLKNRQQSMLYRAAAELGLATHPAW